MSETTIEKPIDRSWPQYLEERFTPHIASSVEEVDLSFHNAVAIDVDLSKTSTLKFDLVSSQIEKVLEKNLLLFFQIDLKLSKKFEDYFDELQFESIRLGLKTFQEKILKPNLTKTFGIGFKFGQLNHNFINPSNLPKIKDYLQTTYSNFNQHFGFDFSELDSNIEQAKLKKEIDLYQVGLVSEYLHRLASCIQEPIEIYAFFDFEGAHSLDVLRFISQERFPYMRLGLKGCNLPTLGLNLFHGQMLGGSFGMKAFQSIEPKLGVVFPIDTKLSLEGEVQFSKLLNALENLKLPFFVLYEDSMTENWQNLEQILVHAQFSDRLLTRKCQGFVAAQGQLIVFGGEMGVFDEISFEECFKSN